MSHWPRHITGPIEVPPQPPASHGLFMKIAAWAIVALLSMSVYIWTGMVGRVEAQDAYHEKKEEQNKEDMARVSALEIELATWKAETKADRERWRQNEAKREEQTKEYDQVISEARALLRRLERRR